MDFEGNILLFWNQGSATIEQMIADAILEEWRKLQD